MTSVKSEFLTPDRQNVQLCLQDVGFPVWDVKHPGEDFLSTAKQNARAKDLTCHLQSTANAV